MKEALNAGGRPSNVPGVRIVDAHDDLVRVRVVRDLFREYETWLDFDLCFQSFEEELESLPGRYVPPLGAMLLALDDVDPAGCVAMAPLGDDGSVCEMKRLWLREPYRAVGLGRRLAEAIMRKASDAGYRYMRLDTLPKLEAAIALYRKLGFEPCEAYYHNPLPGVLYLQARLR